MVLNHLMTSRNNTNPMSNDGAWAKVGSKTYRHESGVTVRYNHNAWLWTIDGETGGYRTLTVAKFYAEKKAA